MARHCMRPGCDRLAAARLTYDTESAAVWLDRPAEDSEPSQQVCSVHAATLTAPLGWTVTDRRLMSVGPAEPEEDPSSHGSVSSDGSVPKVPAPASAPSKGPVEAALPPSAAVAVDAKSEGVVSEPGFPAPDVPGAQRMLPLEDPQVPAEDAAEPEPAAASAAAEEPQKVKAGPSAAAPEPPRQRAGAKGAPRPSLLDRAFEWTGPQHSVLTTDRVVRADRRDAQHEGRSDDQPAD